MPDDRGVLRHVSWRDLLPWLVIFRTFRVATSGPVLLLSAAAALLTPVGWRVAETILPAEDRAAANERGASNFSSIVARNRGWREWSADRPAAPVPPPSPSIPISTSPTDESSWSLRRVWERVLALPLDMADRFWSFVAPMAHVFRGETSPRQAAYAIAGSCWSLLVWSIFGGAITRIAAVRLGRDGRVGLRDALAHAVRKLGPSFAAPVYPLVGVALLALPMALLGLAMQTDIGVLAAGLLWPLALLAGCLMTMLVAGLLFGWPLMWATLGAEGSDAFDALSRSFGYAFQRPLHYLFYATLAALVGAAGYVVVSAGAMAVEEICWWAASWGAGAERLAVVRAAADLGFQNNSGGTLGAGAAVLHACVGVVRLVVTAYSYSYFWCAATAIYLLLRRDVDQTEMDEVFVEGEEITLGLPSLSLVKPGPDKPAPDDTIESKAEDDE